MYKNGQSRKKLEIEKRVIDEARWFLSNETSIRDTARIFMVGKNTVHLDFRQRLKNIDRNLYNRVANLLDSNRMNAVSKMNKINELKRKNKGVNNHEICMY